MTEGEAHAFRAAYRGVSSTWQQVAAFEKVVPDVPAVSIDGETLYKAVEAHAIAVQAFRGLVRQFADKGRLAG